MKHIPMICIEGSNEVVPLVTGFFPQPGFLVVAHENQPKPGHNLLYITPFIPTHKITREAADVLNKRLIIFFYYFYREMLKHLKIQLLLRVQLIYYLRLVLS